MKITSCILARNGFTHDRSGDYYDIDTGWNCAYTYMGDSSMPVRIYKNRQDSNYAVIDIYAPSILSFADIEIAFKTKYPAEPVSQIESDSPDTDPNFSVENLVSEIKRIQTIAREYLHRT